MSLSSVTYTRYGTSNRRETDIGNYLGLCSRSGHLGLGPRVSPSGLRFWALGQGSRVHSCVSGFRAPDL